MTRIVYGVSGEGSGHSSRARVVARHLLAQGHEVKLVSYDRGHANLQREFDVFETEGLHIATHENRVSVVRTLTDNLSRLSDGVRRLRELRQECFHQFRPQVVLTDFEPMTAYLAHHHELPLVSIDNQHRMRYMRYDCPDHLRRDAVLTETVIRMMVPRPDVCLVTTFFFGEVTNARTFLFPPLLRREVLAARAEDGDHVLVYFTQGFDSFLERLKACPRERFRVYGQGREDADGNLDFRAPSQEGFLRDLARARAVVATAGFTLMSEALHLGKPLLALPMRGQFEQELNALLLEQGGFGRNGRAATDETLGDFLYRLPEYRRALDQPRDGGNEALLARLDALVADGGAEAREFRRRRKSGNGDDDGGGSDQAQKA